MAELKHMTVSEFKAAHQGQSIKIRNYEKDGVAHTFFTCGSSVGAVSGKLDINNLGNQELQVVFPITDTGVEIPVLCKAGGATVVAEL